MKIQDVLLASSVKRWTVVNTIHQQNLAEHTFNVVMIARAIAKRLGIDDTKIIKYALDHDLDEILTGDIPTPAKRRLGIDTTPYEGKARKACNSDEISVVVMADLIEAVVFIMDNQVGRHAHTVADKIMDRFKMKCDFLLVTDPKLVGACDAVINDLLEGGFEVENDLRPDLKEVSQ